MGEIGKPQILKFSGEENPVGGPQMDDHEEESCG